MVYTCRSATINLNVARAQTGCGATGTCALLRSYDVGALKAFWHTGCAPRVEVDTDIIRPGARERFAVGRAAHLEASLHAEFPIRFRDPRANQHAITRYCRAQIIDFRPMCRHAPAQCLDTFVETDPQHCRVGPCRTIQPREIYGVVDVIVRVDIGG